MSNCIDWRQGDVLECIKVIPALDSNRLTIGKQYIVSVVFRCAGAVQVVCDNGIREAVANDRFKNLTR